VCGRRFTHLYQRHYLESTNALPSLSALLSYLKTQTASIFTQIKARGAVHPLSGLPSTETLATLPTALSTLSTRKVDVGTSDIDDGEHLLPMICDATVDIEVIKDSKRDWVMNNYNNTILDVFPKAKEIELWVKEMIGYTLFTNTREKTIQVQKIHLPYLEKIENSGAGYQRNWNGLIRGSSTLTEILMPSLSYINHITADNSARFIGNCANLEKVLFGTLTYLSTNNVIIIDCPKLLHLEFGEGTSCNLPFGKWSPTLTDTNLTTFRTNFQTYILNRLSTSVTGRTLTVSASVFAAVSDLEVPAGWTLVSA